MQKSKYINLPPKRRENKSVISLPGSKSMSNQGSKHNRSISVLSSRELIKKIAMADGDVSTQKQFKHFQESSSLKKTKKFINQQLMKSDDSVKYLPII